MERIYREVCALWNGNEKELENEKSEEGTDLSLCSPKLRKRLAQAAVLGNIIETNPCHDSKRKIRQITLAQSRMQTIWRKELDFLERLKNGTVPMNPSRLASSNFHHLHGLLCVLQSPFIEDVCDVLSPMETGEIIKGNRKKHKHLIDLICFAGRLWVSVIARKGSQIYWNASSTESKHGLKEKLTWLIDASSLSPSKPFILLSLPVTVSPLIIDKIVRKYNAFELSVDLPTTIQGGEGILQPYESSFWLFVPPNHPYFNHFNEPLARNLFKNTIDYVNLDTSTLLAITSDITHGKAIKLKKYS